LIRQGAKISRVSHRNEMKGRGMQGFIRQKPFKNYGELLAKERSETERMFLVKVLARKEAENRRHPARGWVIVEAGHSICPTDAGRRLVESR
jgi:hypothetical protein